MRLRYLGPAKDFGYPLDEEATQILWFRKGAKPQEVDDLVAAELLTRPRHNFRGPSKEAERAVIEAAMKHMAGETEALQAQLPEDQKVPEPVEVEVPKTLVPNSPAVIAKAPEV